MRFLALLVLLQCTPREAVVPEASPASIATSASTLADADRLDARSKEREEVRDFASALDDALQALEIRERLLEPSNLAVARSLLRVARVHWILGRYPDVDAVIHRAFPVLEKELGPEAIDTGRALILRSVVILHDRRYREAQPLVERALAIFEKSPQGGENVDEDLHEAMDDLALVHYGLGDYPGAIAMSERALAFGERHFGSNSWRLASSVGGIAEAIRMNGDPKRALPYMERAVVLNEKGPYVRHLASALNNLANIHSYTLHDYAKAEPLYRRAIAISEKVYGPDDINTSQEYMNLGGMLCVQGDWTNGEPLYLKGLEVFERKLGEGHVETVRAKNYLDSLRQRKP